MNTNQTTAHDDTAEHGQAECRCPDDRCAGYHHEVGEYCYCTPLHEPVSNFDEADVIHPPECYGHCIPEGAAMVQHFCGTQAVATGTLNASASMWIHTSERDWRTDDFRSEVAQISVRVPGLGVESLIKCRPADFKTLGEFIIGQAERFDAILSSDSGVAA